MNCLKRNCAALTAIVLLFTILSPLWGGEWKVYAAESIGAPSTTHQLIGNRNANGIYYGNVELELSVRDTGSGVSTTQYSLNDGGSWTTYSQPVMFSDKKVYHIMYQSISSSNNVETPKEVNFTIKKDMYPPETTIEVTGTEGQNSYYISSVSIHLNGTDAHSEIDYTEYSLDAGQTWNRYIDPITMNEQKTTIYYRSRDIDGNVEKAKKAKINIDSTSPTAPDFEISPTEWSNSTFTVTMLDGIDDQSGTMKTQYRLDDSGSWIDYSGPVTVGGDILKNISARTIDNAGNISEEYQYTLKFDKVAPTAPVIGLNYTDWTNDIVYVSIDGGTDSDSSVLGYQYKKGSNSDWVGYISSFSVREEGITSIYARTLDRAGNVSSITENQVKIDLTPPAPPENIFKVNQIGTSALIQWTPSRDNLSGISEYEVYSGETLLGTTKNNKFQLTNLALKEYQSITIVAIDIAGNFSEYSRPLTFFTNSIAVSGYRDHNFAWNQDGQVWGWGLNNYQQLGDGTITNRNVATRNSSLDGFTMISTGLRQNIGLRADGTVWAWGSDNTTRPLPKTKVEGLENIVSISSGLEHSLALKDDGTVWAWGDNGVGQLGIGSLPYNTTVPLQVSGLSSVVSINASYYNSMVLREDGTVWIWGDSSKGVLGYDAPVDHIQFTPLQISGLMNIVQIDMSYLHGLALKNDGTVSSWGFNQSGQLGNGNFINQSSPTQIPNLKNVTKITAAYSHSIALTDTGDVWSWGDNYNGQLGDGTTNQTRAVPVRAAHLKGSTDIESSDFYSLAIKKDGSLWAWGYNSSGQLGNGTTATQITRTLVKGIVFPVDNIPPSVPGEFKSTGKTSTTAVLSWEESIDNNAVKEYLIYKGTTLMDTLVVDGKSIDSVTGYTAIGLSAGTSYTFSVKAKDYAGNTSISSNVVSITTEQTFTTAVSAGSNQTFALKNDGAVWTWGSNSNGQLGNGTLSDSKIPKLTVNLTSITAISAGNSFGLALKSDGTVWGWGNNSSGQLGTQLTYQQYLPIKIEDFNSVVAIAAGNTHSLALKSDGSVWAWGTNIYGELGIGSTSSKYVPTKVPSLTDVKAISAGMFYSFALKNDGTVWAWGSNDYGQLGDGTTTNKSVPVKIGTLSGVDSISAGLYHGLALKQDGTVWTWGYNSNGQLGDGTNTNRSIPIKISSLSGINQISGGMYHSVARSTSSVYSWGSNVYGHLGNGSYSNSNVPVKVSSLSATKDIHAGFNHNVVLSGNNVMTWGLNGNGQLGNGLLSNSSIPVNVTGLSTNTNAAAKGIQSSQVKPNVNTEMDSNLPILFTVPDIIAPTAPADVKAKSNNGVITLNWAASEDNISVKEYWIFIDDKLELKTESNNNVELEGPSSGLFTITIRAVDDAGNFSTSSAPFTP